MIDCNHEIITSEFKKSIVESVLKLMMELGEPKDMINWMDKSGIRKSVDDRSLVVLKYFLLLCSYCACFPGYWDTLANLLPKYKKLLPGDFSKTVNKGLVSFKKR